MKKQLERLRLIDFYLITGLVCTFAVFAALFISNGQFLSEIVWDARNDLFIDFTSCENNQSQWSTCAFFYFLGRFIPDDMICDSSVCRWSELFFIIFLSLSLTIILSIVNLVIKESNLRKALFCVIFVLSQPFAFACIKSGNTLFISLMLLVVACFLMDSKNSVCREMALFCIALAAHLKLAPAIFGICYIREKRYKEALRLIIYGIIFIIFPIVLSGGINQLVTVVSEHADLITPRPETIIGVFIEIVLVIGGSAKTGLMLGKIAAFLYLLICIALLFLYKKSWKTLCLITSILIIFLNMSYPYTLCYMLIPLLAFVKEEGEKKTPLNEIYMVFFALIFTAYPIIRIDWPTATFLTNYFFLYIFLIILIIDIIMDIKKCVCKQKVGGKSS